MELTVLDRIHRETVRTTPKKHDVKPRLREKYWCIPTWASEDPACKMEDVLETCHREREEDTVLARPDETSRQMTGEACTSQPAAPGHKARTDREYRRNGGANLFMVFAPRSASA